MLSEIGTEKNDPEDVIPPAAGPAVSRPDEIWLLDKHRIFCADAREPAAYARLMQGKTAAAMFTDPPYNVAILGHAQGRGRIKHPNFALASGEMDDADTAA